MCSCGIELWFKHVEIDWAPYLLAIFTAFRSTSLTAVANAKVDTLFSYYTKQYSIHQRGVTTVVYLGRGTLDADARVPTMQCTRGTYMRLNTIELCTQHQLLPHTTSRPHLPGTAFLLRIIARSSTRAAANKTAMVRKARPPMTPPTIGPKGTVSACVYTSIHESPMQATVIHTVSELDSGKHQWQCMLDYNSIPSQSCWCRHSLNVLLCYHSSDILGCE